MPLHLLGKKSWNVYNPANIARVRRDEAAAQAREEAEEQRMQEVDAARRLAILRGEVPPPLDDPEPTTLTIKPSQEHRDRPAFGTGRKRKRHGEDDTDFEMRLARERASAGDRAVHELASKPRTTSATPTSLVDSKGHISLFSEPESTRPHEKNEEATREAARKEREFKDQYQMRLVNAAGKEGQGLTDGGPWYASTSAEAKGSPATTVVGSIKDVFGREDPKRKVRAAARLDASDPLGMMKRGAKMVRELDRERRKEVEEREREMRGLEREERRREKRRRKDGDGRDKSERGRDGDERDGRSGRHGRSHRRHEDEGDRRRERSEDRERDSRDRGRDRSDRPDRSSRHHEDRQRDRSRERRILKEENSHEKPRRSGDDRHRRPPIPDHDRYRDRH